MTKKSTPIPPGYKQTKIGVLPVEWEVEYLKDIIHIRSGQVDPKEEPYASMFLVAPNHIESDSGTILNYETAKSQGAISGKYEVHAGDIIYSKIRPYLKKAAIANTDCICSADMYAINGRNVINEYLLAAMLGGHFTNYANSVSARTGMPKINRQDLLAYKIPLPPLPQQQKIAQILATWDQAITTQTQLIDAKKEQKRGLMQRLLTGEVRLEGFEEEWKSQRFRKLFEPHSEKAGEREFEVLSVTKDGIIAQSQYFNKEIASRDTSPYKVVRKGQLAMSGLNFWMGAIDILTKFDSGIISPAYKVFKVNYDILAPNYAIYLVRSRIIVKVLVGASVQGASIVRRNLDKNMLHSSKILTPPLPEQTAIAKILTTADQEIALLKSRLTELREQKRGLMQRLLTGAVRVTPDA